MKRWKKKSCWSEHTSSQIWCYLKFERWKFFFSVKPNLVLFQIQDMNNEMKRWKSLLGSEHMSSQIWCYFKFERWRVRWRKKNFDINIHQANSAVISNSRDDEWDEEMKKTKFSVQTYVKPNLVLFQIWEMKKKKFRYKHTSSQLCCYLKFKRWWVGWRDEKNKIFSPNICEAKSGVISNLRDEEWDEEMKKNFLVWAYIKPNLVLSQIQEMVSEMKR